MSDQYRGDQRAPNAIPQSPSEVRVPSPPRDEVTHPVHQTAASPSLPLQPVATPPSSSPSTERRPPESAGPAQPISASQSASGQVATDREVKLTPPPSSRPAAPSLTAADLDAIARAAIQRRKPKWQAEFDRIQPLTVELQKRGMKLAEIHGVLVDQFDCKLPYKALCAHMPTKRKRKAARQA